MANINSFNHDRSKADDTEFKELCQSVATNINKMNQTVSKIQRMITQLDTTKETSL